jgi:hypothetical protein
MNIYVNGQKIVLSQKNYVTKGGEGSIYKKEKTAFKIYEDLRKMIPLAKIGELNVLDKPTIVKPQDPIYNEDKHLVGFTMEWLGNDIYPLCKLFTNGFRDANGITNDTVIELVENIKKDIHYIHQHKCLIVDGNELNYMVGSDFVTPYFIDVNSWQTPSFGATAIMPSIRDWTTTKFNELTDWFSFAIVSFQLFIGIHPFKGTHQGYKRNDFKKRIIDHISVFNPTVSLPHSVRDFNLIPTSYKDWYMKIFENGNRVPPPNLPGAVLQAQVVVHLIQSTDNFEIREIKQYPEKILFHNPTFNFTKTENKIYISKTDYQSLNEEVIFTPLEQIPVFVRIENGKVLFRTFSYQPPVIDLDAEDKMIVNNILYLRNRERLMEMDFKYLGGKIHAMIKQTWNVEPFAAKLFGNVVYQSALGASVLSIPLSTSARSQFITKRIPELDEFSIIDARYENQVCILTGHNDGVYSRIIIIFDSNHDNYKCRIVGDIDYSSINFTTLDNGVCVMITDDDAIEMFLNRIDKDSIKRIEDPVINSTMRLCKNGTKVMFFRDNKLYEIKMK